MQGAALLSYRSAAAVFTYTGASQYNSLSEATSYRCISSGTAGGVLLISLVSIGMHKKYYPCYKSGNKLLSQHHETG